MKFDALRYFHVTQKCGSIRKAAERLHIAPSAISRQIAILERELKLSLFERTPSGVTTTAAGRLLALHTQSIFRDLGRAQSAINDLKALRVGEVTIYAMEGLVSDFLPSLLSSFHARFPGISFNLMLASTDRIIEALIQDEADIGLTFNAKPRRDLKVVARFTESVSCIVAPDHPLAREKSVTLAKLKHFPLALPNDTFGLRQLVDLTTKRRRLAPQTLLTTNSLEMTKTLAATGAAVAFMPAFTVRAEVDRGSLRCIPVDEKAFKSASSEVCIHRNRDISVAAREFLAALIEEVDTLKAPRT